MKELYTLVFFICGIASYAQETKAILFFRDGTELEGYGRIKGNKILFTIDLEEEADTWTDLMVDGIYFEWPDDAATYKYVDLQGRQKYTLLKVIELGAYNLYEKEKATYSNSFSGADLLSLTPTGTSVGKKTTYIINKSGSKDYTTLSWIRKRRTIRTLFSDCADFVETYDSGEFKKQSIAELVSYYNYFCAEE